MTKTTSDFLSLVRSDLNNIETYARAIKSGIDDNEFSEEDVLHRLLSLKIYIDPLYKEVGEYISDPYLLADGREK